MASKGRLAVGVAGALLLAVVGRRLYENRATPHVPYETVGHIGDVELRRYPTSVIVETAADSERRAFGRLFRYISGANDGGRSISMTAPVETGVRVPMTAPVETSVAVGRSDVPLDDVDDRMAFYLPADYDFESAPRPTDPAVHLVEVPARTLAVLPFSWWTSDGRVARKIDRLRSTLSGADVTVVGEPSLMRYDAPGTPPFLRTNEVCVEVRRTTR